MASSTEGRLLSALRRINILRIIVEQCVEFSSPDQLLFIDLEKAFDNGTTGNN